MKGRCGRGGRGEQWGGVGWRSAFAFSGGVGGSAVLHGKGLRAEEGGSLAGKGGRRSDGRDWQAEPRRAGETLSLWGLELLL